MNITIIGWYGTETIGDRAILAGLFRVFSIAFERFKVRLGCINTLLTERTLDEDYRFYQTVSKNSNIDITLFDSRYKKQLDDSIKWSDLVVIGGGPLMGINEMYMLKYAFTKAHSQKKRTFVAGCGMGPFNKKEFEEVACDIVDLSDLAIFRDAKSKEFFLQHSHCKTANVYDSVDPAVFAAMFFRGNETGSYNTEDYVACNFRQVTAEYLGNNSSDYFFAEELVRINENLKLPIKLVPMHSYYMGGDDRFILNRIKRLSGIQDVEVLNRPPSLMDVMRIYRDAKYCVGMRFHSILLQTILNGKNFVYDYTDAINGKIINVLIQLGVLEKYKNRYFSLVKQEGCLEYSKDIKVINMDMDKVNMYMNTYISELKKIMNK